MASKWVTVANLFRSSRSPFSSRVSFSAAAAPANHPWCKHLKSVANSSTSSILQVTMIADMKHPFLTQGLSAMGYVEQHVTKAIVKVDMPGIGKQALNIRLKGNEIHIEGDAEKEDDGLVRRYSGVLDLPSVFYNTDEIEASISLGVLNIVIPKLRPTVNAVPSIRFRGWGPIYSAKVKKDN